MIWVSKGCVRRREGNEMEMEKGWGLQDPCTSLLGGSRVCLLALSRRLREPGVYVSIVQNPTSSIKPERREKRHTCGKTPSTNLLAPATSPKQFNIAPNAPTAAHNPGANLARKLTLAARSATLKPLSGLPTFCQRLACISSTDTRWKISALSSLRDLLSAEMAVKASGYCAVETR
jgi:hypothetical protein